MITRGDARVPVRFGSLEEAGPESGLLVEGDARLPEGRAAAWFTVPPLFGTHPAGCPCCAPRAPVAKALAALFLARARGECPFFHEVIAVVSSVAGRVAVLAALESDPLIAAWFRATGV